MKKLLFLLMLSLHVHADNFIPHVGDIDLTKCKKGETCLKSVPVDMVDIDGTILNINVGTQVFQVIEFRRNSRVCYMRITKDYQHSTSSISCN